MDSGNSMVGILSSVGEFLDDMKRLSRLGFMFQRLKMKNFFDREVKYV